MQVLLYTLATTYLNVHYSLTELFNNNRNEGSKQQSLDFNESQAEQATEFQTTFNKGAL